MGLYQEWQKQGENLTDDQLALYWSAYLDAEKEAYRIILSEKNNLIEGTIKELADKFNLTKVQMAGFIDGINTSLEDEIDLDSLEEDTFVSLNIVWDKLYRNMLDSKAKWLWELEEWDGIINEDERLKIRREFNQSRMAKSTKVGRNEPCPCGSGKKYKRCCME